MTSLELAQKTCNEPNFIALDSQPEIVDNLFETTWQYLQYPDLAEKQLRPLQRAWEGMDLLRAVEPAFALDRAFVEDRYELQRRELSLLHKGPRELFKILAGLIKDFNGTTEMLRYNALEARESFRREAEEYTNAQAQVEAARSLGRDHVGALLKVKLPASAIVETVARHRRNPTSTRHRGHRVGSLPPPERRVPDESGRTATGISEGDSAGFHGWETAALPAGSGRPFLVVFRRSGRLG